MLNQTVLVGRIVKDIEQEGETKAIVTLAPGQTIELG